jgi:hypothetical protein
MTCHDLKNGETDPKKLNWHKDSGIKQLLNSSLTSEEVAKFDATNKFDATKIGKVSWLQNNYEAKILQAIHKVISGEEFGDEALKQAQDMEEKIQQLKQQNAEQKGGKDAK